MYKRQEETEAVAIRQIFELYTSSEIGLGGIANQLNLQGIRTVSYTHLDLLVDAVNGVYEKARRKSIEISVQETENITLHLDKHLSLIHILYQPPWMCKS